MSFKSYFQSSSKGFTLVELLIVIAVIGVLAGVVITVINPLEQLAKSRDTGRFSTVGQLSKAVSASFISSATGAYPTQGATWMSALTTSQELRSIPNTIPGGTACTVNNHNGFCYATFTTGGNADAAVWTPLESTTEKTGCATYAVAIWVASLDKVGTACLAGAGTTPSGSTTIY